MKKRMAYLLFQLGAFAAISYAQTPDCKNSGIGLMNPNSKLEIRGCTDDSTKSVLNTTNSSGASLLFIRNDGRIGIGGQVIPQARLHLRGMGTTSSTHAFRIDNASGSNVASLNDAGQLNVSDSYWLYGVRLISSYRAGGNVTNNGNLFVGYNVGNTSLMGGDVSLFGGNNGTVLTSGTVLTGIGYSALSDITSGQRVVAVGSYAGRGNPSNSVFVGSYAGNTISTGIRNIFIGDDAGKGVTTGNDNLIIGTTGSNGFGITTAGRNVLIGNYLSHRNGNHSNTIGLSPYEAYIESSNTLLLGGGEYTSRIENIILGVDDSNHPGWTLGSKQTPFTIHMHPGKIIGSDRNGYSIKLSGGKSTGTGAGGDLVFATTNSGTSGTTENNLTDRLTIKGGTGQVNISSLSGSGTRMVVSDSAGNLSAQTISGGGGLPSGTSGQTLRHDGTGWVAGSNLHHDGTYVGVGTVSPQSYLHIYSPGNEHIRLSKNNGSNSRYKIFLGNGTGGYADEEIYHSGHNSTFHFMIDGNEKLTVAPTGVAVNKPAISTSEFTVGYHQRINYPGGGNGLLFLQSSDATDSDISFSTNNSTNARARLYVDHVNQMLNLRAYNSDITFITGGSPAERMRIANNGNIGISTAAPKSTLHTSGSFGAKAVTITGSTYSAGNEMVILANTGSNSITIDLPAAADVTDRIYIIKKINSANTVTIDASGSEQIDGATTQSLTALNSRMMIISNGTGWYIID